MVDCFLLLHLYADSGRDSCLVVMLDLAHLGNQVRRLDNSLIGVASRQYQLGFFRLIADQLQHLIDINQAEADSAVNLVADKQVKFS